MTTLAYALRSLDTGEFMPEMRNHRGYSYWSPKAGKVTARLARETGLPRLFPDARSAAMGRASWAMGIFSVQDVSSEPYADGELVATDMGRKVTDLQIVEVHISYDETDT